MRISITIPDELIVKVSKASKSSKKAAMLSLRHWLAYSQDKIVAELFERITKG